MSTSSANVFKRLLAIVIDEVKHNVAKHYLEENNLSNQEERTELSNNTQTMILERLAVEQVPERSTTRDYDASSKIAPKHAALRKTVLNPNHFNNKVFWDKLYEMQIPHAHFDSLDYCNGKELPSNIYGYYLGTSSNQEIDYFACWPNLEEVYFSLRNHSNLNHSQTLKLLESCCLNKEKIKHLNDYAQDPRITEPNAGLGGGANGGSGNGPSGNSNGGLGSDPNGRTINGANNDSKNNSGYEFNSKSFLDRLLAISSNHISNRLQSIQSQIPSFVLSVLTETVDLIVKEVAKEISLNTNSVSTEQNTPRTNMP